MYFGGTAQEVAGKRKGDGAEGMTVKQAAGLACQHDPFLEATGQSTSMAHRHTVEHVRLGTQGH